MDSWCSDFANYMKDLNPLIECFLTIGLTQKDITNHTDFGDKLEPKILSQFPPPELCRIKVPESLPTFCFPNMIELVKDQEVSSNAYNNILTDEHGDLLYCSILKIFEPIEEKVEFELEYNELTVPELFLSKSASSDRSASPVSPTLFNFYDKDRLLVPKGIVILSKQPLFMTFQKILLGLYKLSKKTLMYPLECYISHMITQIPLPPKGRVIIRYLLGYYVFSISLPPLNKLPTLDLNLGLLFSSLDLDTLLLLFRNIILEKSTVFISNSEQKLAFCTYSILSFLFPMHWNMVYVPILPESLLDYLYSPVTFIFGVHSRYLDEIYSRVNDSVCLIDLDHNKFLVSENLTYHRVSSLNTELPWLPGHYGKKLRKNLNNTLSKAGVIKGKLIKLAKAELDESSASSIRHHFFQFFVSILKDYKKYMIFDGKDVNSSTFNASGFIHNTSDRDFMGKFTETQMFSNFCESRIRPKNVEEHCEGLLFDEEISAKENRSSLNLSKAHLTFITDNSQENCITYTVPAIDTFFSLGSRYNYDSFPDFDINHLKKFALPTVKPPKYVENIEKKSASSPIWETNSECLLTSWMDLWGLFLSSQHSSEHNRRIQELIKVAEQLQRSTSVLTLFQYKYLLEKCFFVQPNLALPIFSFMSSSKIPTDAETLQILQKIVSKLYAADQNIVMQNTGTNLVITQMAHAESTDIKRKRVFTRPECSSVFAKQEVAFMIKEICKKCGKVLKIEDLVQNWSKIAYKLETACVYCGDKILPKLVIRLGLEIGYNKDRPTTVTEETLFISLQALRQLVSDLIISQKELKLEQFRCGYPMIFWNSVWYFNQYNLPFDFLLLYEEEEANTDLFLTTEALQNSWDIENRSKSTQTELSGLEIEKALEKNHKFYMNLNIIQYI